MRAGSAAVGGLGVAGLMSKRADGQLAPTADDSRAAEKVGPVPLPPHRRRFIRNAAIAGGAAWVAPAVLSFNTPVAANSGTCTGPPAFLGPYSEDSDIGVQNATVTRTLTPSSVPTVGANLIHLAVVNIDHVQGAAASSATTPAGWTLLGHYDSDVTTAGTTATGSTANWSQRLYVFVRMTGLASSYSFDVTFTGLGIYTPQCRVVVAAYENVNGVANDSGEFALQGSGLIDPLSPPPNALIPLPSISSDLASTLVVGVGGAGNVSSTNAVTTPPTGYTTDVVANTGSGFPPIWLFSDIFGVGAVPSTTAEVVLGAMNVGGQLTVECG